jgi:hypothetical protein
MLFRNSWRRILRRKDQLPLRGRRPVGRRPAPRRALTLESLEARIVPALFPAVNLSFPRCFTDLVDIVAP